MKCGFQRTVFGADGEKRVQREEGSGLWWHVGELVISKAGDIGLFVQKYLGRFLIDQKLALTSIYSSRGQRFVMAWMEVVRRRAGGGGRIVGLQRRIFPGG